MADPFDLDVLLAHRGFVRAVARGILGDDAAADDASQDALLSAWRARSSAPQGSTAWFATIARRAALALRRSESRRSSRERDLAHGDPTPSSEQILAREEARRRVVEAVLALGEPYRSTVVLLYLEERSTDDVARRLGVSANTIRSRVTRARELLRARLSREFGSRDRAFALLAPLAAPPAGGAVATAALLGGGSMLSKCLAVGCVALVLFGTSWWIAAPTPDDASPAHDERATASAPADVIDAGAAATQARAHPEVATRSLSTPQPESAAARSLAVVTGRVVDENTQPVFGATVACGVEEPVRTDADGRFAWTTAQLTFEPKDVALTVRANGFVERTLAVGVEGQANQNVGDVTLLRSASIAGRVVDADSRPVANARLFVQRIQIYEDEWRTYGPSDQSVVAGVSANDGSFRIDGVAPGPVHVYAKGERTWFARSAVIGLAAATVSDGVVIVVEPLDARDSIDGVVVGTDGEPQPFATVLGMIAENGGRIGRTFAVDERGRFQIVCASDRSIDLFASDGGNPARETRADAVEPGTHDVELRLQAPLAARMRVMDAAGRALDGVEVAFSGMLGSSRLALAPDGTYALPRLGDDAELQIEAPGHETKHVGPLDGAWALDLTVTLAASARVRGVVLANGSPIAGARVRIQTAARSGEHVRAFGYPQRAMPPVVSGGAETDGRGQFDLPVELDQSFYVRVDAIGYAPTFAGPYDEPASDALTLELRAGGAIEGRVVAADGKSPQFVPVVATCGDGTIVSMRTDVAGMFRFVALSPGSWLVAVTESEPTPSTLACGRFAGSAALETNCVVEDRGTTRIDLQLPRREACTVRGAFHASIPAGTVGRVGLVSPGGLYTDGDVTLLGGDGAFAAHAASPGDYTVALSLTFPDGSSVVLTRAIVVQAGETAVNWILEGGRVEGQCSTPPKTGLTQVYSRCELPPDVAEGSAPIAASGTFAFAWLPAGATRFECFGRPAIDAVVKTGDTVFVDVQDAR